MNCPFFRDLKELTVDHFCNPGSIQAGGGEGKGLLKRATIYRICSIIIIMKLRYLIILLPLMPILACAPLFPSERMKDVDPEITFPALIKDPEKYKGRTVILGGKIIKIEFQAGKSWIEVLQLPLDWRMCPKETDESGGRFLAFFADSRDPAIFSPGRKLTVIGLVSGGKTLLIGQKEYHYPVLNIQESHLWQEEPKSGLFFHFGIGLGGTF